jgi:hypothetical protein
MLAKDLIDPLYCGSREIIPKIRLFRYCHIHIKGRQICQSCDPEVPTECKKQPGLGCFYCVEEKILRLEEKGVQTTRIETRALSRL